jgi:hypothetical protein
MSNPLQGTESGANAIARVRYTQDAMIDLVIANPAISQNEIAKHFGYTAAWVSRIFSSDAFQARLAERKDEIVNPALTASVEDRIKGLAMQSLEILESKLALTQNPDLAVKCFELSTKAAGYGARQANVAVQNNFVVHMPNKIEDPHVWADAHRPGAGAGPRPAAVIDVEVTSTSN